MKKRSNRDFIWNAIGLTLNSFNSLFFLIIVRYINGLDIAGIFTYAFALCALFYFVSLYFNRSFQISETKNFNFSDYFTCRIFLSTISLILIFIFSLLNNSSVYEISIIMLLMLFRLTESVSDCFYGAIHQKSKLYQTGISLSLKAVLGLLAFFVVNYLTKNLSFAIATLFIINLLIFFVYDFKNYKNLYSEKIKFNFKKVKSILKACFPIFLFSILSLYLINCQKYILPYFDTNEAETILGILIMPATLLSLIGSYLVNPILEPLIDHFKTNNKKDFLSLAKKTISILTLIGALTLIGCYFLGIPLLNFIYHLDLSSFRLPFLAIVLSSIFYAVSMIFSSLLTVLKENAKQTYIYIIVSIITTIASIFLIKDFGIAGGAYAFLISGFSLLSLYILLFCFTFSKWSKNEQ